MLTKTVFAKSQVRSCSTKTAGLQLRLVRPESGNQRWSQARGCSGGGHCLYLEFFFIAITFTIKESFSEVEQLPTPVWTLFRM